MIRVLNEHTRPRLLVKSRKETPSRYARRMDSSNDWYLERVGILELDSGSEDLYLYFRMKKKYRVSVVILGFKSTLDKYLSGKYKNNPEKAISKAITHSLRYNHINTSCSCPDFKYRFAYMATKRGYTTVDSLENRPANITNPDSVGGLCKHQLRVLKSPSTWKQKVVNSLLSYIKKRGKYNG